MEQEPNYHVVKTYVITNVTKINRKIYNIFKINVGRAIPLRSLLYFLSAFGIVFILRHIPLLNYLFLWIPFTICYFGIPIGAAYLLAGISTEDRTPLAFFRSFISYQLRKQRKKNYFRGREVQKPITYRFRGMPTYSSYNKNNKDTERKYKFGGSPTYKIPQK